MRQIQQDVEARYGVPVEAVTVGDCELDDNLNALLAAAREATVNAAKWSGASVISLFAEVEPGEVSLVVRDRGKGFDPAAVPADRKGAGRIDPRPDGPARRHGDREHRAGRGHQGHAEDAAHRGAAAAEHAEPQMSTAAGSCWSTTTACSGPGSAPSSAGRSRWWARRTTCSPRST